MNLIPETPDENLRAREALLATASDTEKDAIMAAEDAEIAAMTDDEFYAWMSEGGDPLAGLV
jgi:hypothetical protein